MKAVIMAGGKGTRLRPLTSRLPKPMVPLLNKPCMEYIIELLKRYGITEIAVTVQYLPQVIQHYFGDGSDYGVQLHYYEETLPLGTAGSVKNAADFLDDTFIVISGDALTDFNLDQAISFHQKKGGLGTLVLHQVDNPLEFGVVMTDETGRIIRFLEKPSWSEVFSDTVNTGIYVLEPEILSFFDHGQVFDFSKDLFPLVMEKGHAMYGYVAEGYWSDIGNLAQYRKTQLDMLEGRVQVQIPGREVQPGIWMGKGCQVAHTAKLEAPVFVGDGSVIDSNAQVGPYTVIGKYNRVGKSAEVVRSIVWNRTQIDKAVAMTDATVTHDVQIGAGAQLAEDVVVGEKSRIGEKAWLRSGVKVWPEKQVAPAAILDSSLIWESEVRASLFGSDGVSGIANVEMTPEKVTKIITAYASLLKPGSHVLLAWDGDPYSEILARGVTASLLASGHCVQDVGCVPAPVARYGVGRLGCVGGIYLHRRGLGTDGQMVLQFFDADGLPLDKGWERKIENAWIQEEALRPAPEGYGTLETHPRLVKLYQSEALQGIDTAAIRKRGLKVVLHAANPMLFSVVHPLLTELGCLVVTVIGGDGQLQQEVKDNQADLGIHIEGDGQNFVLYTGEGTPLSQAATMLLQMMAAITRQSTIPIPVNTPTAWEQWLEQMGVQTVRTTTLPRSLLAVGQRQSLQVFYDAVYTLVTLLEVCAIQEKSLQQLLDELPPVYLRKEQVSCPVTAKGKVMRRLMEELKERPLELIDGIKVLMENGWAMILPDETQAHFQVMAQGNTEQDAQDLITMYKDKISSYK